MRIALTALTDELRRLKAAGVKTVSVSSESVVALRSALIGLRAASPGLEAKNVEAASRRFGPAEEAARTHLREASPGPAPLPPPPRPPVVVEGKDKQQKWDKLRELVLNDPECRRHVRPGKKIVLGVGSLDARIMFVGEAPGGEEEIQGEPFVGPAGQLLTRMIQAMGLQRADVYIGNIMNWRPEMPVEADGVQHGNRPPSPEELAYCLPYLQAQIDIVAPEYLVALGSTAAQALLGAGAFKALGEVRGRWKEFQGRPLMVTYHPSYILRNQSNKSKRMIWEDLLQVMVKAGIAVSDRQRAYFLEK